MLSIRTRNQAPNFEIAAAEASVKESPNVSLTHRSQALGISATSLRRILRNDLGLHPYKIKLTQELKPLDHQQRRTTWNNLKMIQSVNEKSSSAMRLISGWMASSTNKICVIGQTAIHTYSMSLHCIQKCRTFSVMIKTGTLLWIGIATIQW